ncbi:MAG TPA: SCO family protein [Chitinophagaceae bacterium]|nr:SCO family protein [Chitinophagaceae bacterium]
MNKLVYAFVWTAFLFFACMQSEKQEAVLVTDGLPYYQDPSFTPFWFAKQQLPDTLHRIPAFDFLNQDGVTITRDSLEGKIAVVDFFFTKCPGICPKLAKHMRMVLDSCQNNQQVILLSHSVTPEYDTGKVLQEYAQRVGAVAGQWHLLTGDKKAIYTIARKSYFADEDLGLQKNENDFLHTENLILLDRQQHIRGVYKGTNWAEVQQLIADIKTLSKE